MRVIHVFVLLTVVFAGGLWALPTCAQTTPTPKKVKPAAMQQLTPAAATQRKLQLLNAAGIKVAPATVQSSTILSVRQPWINSRTYLDIFQAETYRPQQESVQLKGNPENGSLTWVQVLWPADRSKRYLLDCEVGGSVTSFRFRRGGSRPFVDTVVTAAGGRAGFVLNAGESGSVFVFGLGEGRSWSLKNCEITPVG